MKRTLAKVAHAVAIVILAIVGVVPTAFSLVACGQTPKPSRAKTPPAEVSSSINARQLLDDVKILSSDRMEGRKAGTPGGVRARAYVTQRFKESGLKPFGDSYVREFDFSDAKEKTTRRGANVVGYVRGAARPDRYVVVTAHYDHLGVRDGKTYNGADDNASGVSALFALAEFFSRNRPAHSIIFAALDVEEGGGAGAKNFVNSPPVPKGEIVLNVNLDMVSHSERGELYAAGAHHYPFLKPYLERVAAHAPVKLLLGHDRPDLPKGDDWTFSSDHGAFHRERIPFVYFGNEDHPNYHRPTDDFETITPEFYARAVETILQTLRLFDSELQTIETERIRHERARKE